MRGKAEEIGKAGVKYRADPFPADPDNPDQTSNSIVRAALDEAGVPLDKALPDGISPDRLPGIHDNLAEKMEEVRREREREKKETRSERDRPNPIKGEIGGTDDQNPAPADPADPSVSNADGKPQSHDISTDAGDDDLENASPENRAFMDDVLKPLKPVDEIMLKPTEDLTEGEFMELKKAMIDWPAGPDQDRLDKAATRFLEHRFGAKPVNYDAVGRMIGPKPVHDIPETPKPITNADGKPLKYDLRRIGRNILKDAKLDGLAAAVKRLQGGLNILDQTPKLKEAGVFGRKSRAGLRHAVVSLGASKVEEGLALGRFNAFARDGQKQGFSDLARATEKSFAPLFRNTAMPVSKPTDRIETVTLQEALNDLGGPQSGGETFKPLKLDGDIGPRTTETFGQLANALPPNASPNVSASSWGFSRPI